jgi:Ser/Thr protein kinase RdoA (MazF antagonist)
VEVDQPPDRILAEYGLTVLPGEVRPREGRAWLVGWQGTRGVLRRQQLPQQAGSGTAIASVTWLHGFLARLAGLGFPSPQPLPSFGGRSWAADGDELWEIVSYLPGRTVGWAAEPPLAEVGSLLGRYHAAARQAGAGDQRPGALPLAAVPGLLLSGKLEAAGVPEGQAAAIRELARQLASDLPGGIALTSDRVVIHGDFTAHNVVADGTPPVASGVIDFALAHVDTPLADIGYGLWRSGRPRQDADRLDLSRVRQFLRGYASMAPITADQARVIPVYLGGRGLQMIAKRIRAGRPETGMLAEVQWISANRSVLADALTSAVAT